MTEQELVDLFEMHIDGEYLEDERLTEVHTKRNDLNGFMILERLVPGKRDIIAHARHDKIYLEIDLNNLAAVATEEDVKNLLRCGVMYSDDGLEMHV